MLIFRADEFRQIRAMNTRIINAATSKRRGLPFVPCIPQVPGIVKACNAHESTATQCLGAGFARKRIVLLTLRREVDGSAWHRDGKHNQGSDVYCSPETGEPRDVSLRILRCCRSKIFSAIQDSNCLLCRSFRVRSRKGLGPIRKSPTPHRRNQTPR